MASVDTYRVKVTYDGLNSDKKGDVSLEDFKTVMRAQLRAFDKLDGSEDGVITNGGSLFERNGLAGSSGDGLFMFDRKAKEYGLPTAKSLGAQEKGWTLAAPITGEDSRYVNVDTYLNKLFAAITGEKLAQKETPSKAMTRADAQAYVANNNFNDKNKNFWLKMY